MEGATCPSVPGPTGFTIKDAAQQCYPSSKNLFPIKKKKLKKKTSIVCFVLSFYQIKS